MNIKHVVRSCVGVIGAGILLVNSAVAAPIIMSGDYVRTAISDDGTLGYGGGATPGLLYDATGTGTFTYDYLTQVPRGKFSVFLVMKPHYRLIIMHGVMQFLVC